MALDGVGEEEVSVNAKIRYSHKGAPCKIRRIGEDMVECRFDEPVRAATPGQAVVFYQGDHVAGGELFMRKQREKVSIKAAALILGAALLTGDVPGISPVKN